MIIKLTILITLLSFVASITPISPIDDTRIHSILNNITNSSNPITNEFNELLAIFKETYNLDKCTEDLRTLIEGTAAYRIFAKRDYHDKIYDELIGVLIEAFFFDVKVQALFAANQHCAEVYNFVRYLCLEFRKSLGIPSSESFKPRDQIVNTTFENGYLRAASQGIENFNAFWACTVDNIKFFFLLQSLYRNGYFRPGDLDAVHSIGLQFAYNLEHCKTLADLIVGAEKKFFATMNLTKNIEK